MTHPRVSYKSKAGLANNTMREVVVNWDCCLGLLQRSAQLVRETLVGESS